MMKASDVMVTDVIAVSPGTSVREAAKILLERRISAAPVLDAQGRLAGIVSEGDLMRRAEIGTERPRSWWLNLLSSDSDRAADYVKSHGGKVGDVMTRNVITVTEDTPLGEIATLLERHGIKRAPVMRGEQVVGIVSRANLLQAFASSAMPDQEADMSDAAVRERVMASIRAQPGGVPWLTNVTVHGGVVELWGPVDTEEERKALLVAAEATPGVRQVKDNLFRWPRGAE